MSRSEKEEVGNSRPNTPWKEKAKILIVDDEPMVANSLRRALRDHDVSVALGGREAMECIGREREYDLILCDLTMPEMSGMQLYENMQRMHPRMAERIVFMSGSVFTSSAQKFLSSISNLSIEKPIDTEHLREIVRHRTNPPPEV